MDFGSADKAGGACSACQETIKKSVSVAFFQTQTRKLQWYLCSEVMPTQEAAPEGPWSVTNSPSGPTGLA